MLQTNNTDRIHCKTLRLADSLKGPVKVGESHSLLLSRPLRFSDDSWLWSFHSQITNEKIKWRDSVTSFNLFIRDLGHRISIFPCDWVCIRAPNNHLLGELTVEPWPGAGSRRWGGGWTSDFIHVEGRRECAFWELMKLASHIQDEKRHRRP